MPRDTARSVYDYWLDSGNLDADDLKELLIDGVEFGGAPCVTAFDEMCRDMYEESLQHEGDDDLDDDDLDDDDDRESDDDYNDDDDDDDEDDNDDSRDTIMTCPMCRNRFDFNLNPTCPRCLVARYPATSRQHGMNNDP